MSVIVPVYKAGETLRRCVDSILGQDFGDFELLLIDDGSPDGSGAICDAYAAGDARVKVWHKENGGVGTARNLGLDVAAGEWVAFVDADDFLEKGFFRGLLEGGGGRDLVIGGYKTLPGGKRHYGFEGDFEGDSMPAFIARHLENGYVWGKFYKASILKACGIRFRTDLAVFEDLLFNLDYVLQCGSIRIVPLCLYAYVTPRGKMAEEKYALLPDEIRRIYALVEERLDKLGRKFHCWRPPLVFDFIGHYPLGRILEQGSDEELYRLYVELKGDVGRTVFYNDRVASPIIRFISSIKREYVAKKNRKRGRELARAVCGLYGRGLLRVRYASASKRLQAELIARRHFFLLDVYFALRSFVNLFWEV